MSSNSEEGNAGTSAVAFETTDDTSLDAFDPWLDRKNLSETQLRNYKKWVEKKIEDNKDCDFKTATSISDLRDLVQLYRLDSTCVCKSHKKLETDHDKNLECLNDLHTERKKLFDAKDYAHMQSTLNKKTFNNEGCCTLFRVTAFFCETVSVTMLCLLCAIVQMHFFCVFSPLCP